MSINKEDVRNIVAEVLEVEVEEVTDNADYVNDLGADSLKALELLATLEQEYGISIPETQLPRLTSFDNTLEVLEEFE